jgi:hypothetical protein
MIYQLVIGRLSAQNSKPDFLSFHNIIARKRDGSHTVPFPLFCVIRLYVYTLFILCYIIFIKVQGYRQYTCEQSIPDRHRALHSDFLSGLPCDLYDTAYRYAKEERQQAGGLAAPQTAAVSGSYRF